MSLKDKLFPLEFVYHESVAKYYAPAFLQCYAERTGASMRADGNLRDAMSCQVMNADNTAVLCTLVVVPHPHRKRLCVVMSMDAFNKMQTMTGAEPKPDHWSDPVRYAPAAASN